jgi:hypothetical protein
MVADRATCFPGLVEGRPDLASDRSPRITCRPPRVRLESGALGPFHGSVGDGGELLEYAPPLVPVLTVASEIVVTGAFELIGGAASRPRRYRCKA